MDYSLNSRIASLSIALAVLVAASAAASADRSLVLLNAGAIDVRAGGAAAARTMSFAGNRLHLVQYAGPIQPEWYRELEATGVRVVTYIPHNAYLVYGDAGALAALRQLASAAPHIRGEAPYLDEYKIDRRGRGGPGKPDDSGDWFAVQAVIDPGANASTDALVDSVRADARTYRYQLAGYRNTVARFPEAALEALARRPDVVSIQPFVLPRRFDERQSQIVAGNVSGSIPTAPGYLSWLAGRGFTQAQFNASGFVVDVTDSGIDDGTTTPNHFALFESGTLNGVSRVAYNRLEGTPNIGSTLAGCDGHGTLNAHIVAGYSTLTGPTHTDAVGYRYGLGVAPFVRVGSSVIFDPDSYTFPDFGSLQSRAYNSGARISSNSWGTPNFGRYDINAQMYDALARDAQPASSPLPVAGNQEMVLVFAAGNSGPGSQSLGSPGTAKNVITVGAAENVRSFSGLDGCGVGDTGADNANEMADFSSRGPTFDGRIKPEIVAPGTHVTGGVIQSGVPGIANGCFNANGVCGGVASRFFPAGQEYYTASSGTSHAAPAVAGGAALLRQHFINRGLTPPSPAMTKAYLTNAARYLSGPADTLPSIHQGLGEVNLGTAFDTTARILRDQVPAETFTATGQARVITGMIPDSTKPVRISLAWTDAPGATTGAAYRNDLDLVVIAGGKRYLGNVFNGALSVVGGTADFRNNLENVFLPAGTTGSFSVSVIAANINSDGVPNSGGPLDQDFALVIYNANEVLVPVLGTGSMVLSAENCGPANGAVDPDETVAIAFELVNRGTASTTDLVATLEASGGVQPATVSQNYGAIAPGAALARAFAFVANGSCGGQLTATLRLRDGATDLGSAAFTIPLGATQTFNPQFTIVESIFIPDSGPAPPYPSVLSVSGVTGTVRKVTVTVHTMTHTYPDDIDIVLVGPLGQKIMLMSDAGGGENISGLTFTFDSTAAFPLPDSGGLVSGTFKPTDYDIGDVMPLPGPGPPYGNSLAVFNTLNPNGTWSLYVADDGPEDSGTILGGWTLDFTTSDPVCCRLPGTLQFTVNAFSALEGPVGARVDVARVRGNAGAVTVRVATSNGTATAGTDYVATNEIVTFAADDSTTKTVVIPLLNDSAVEGEETINVALSDFTGGAIAGTPSSAVVTVIDDETLPALSVGDASLVEGNSGTALMTFNVALSATRTYPVAVSYSTANGTAGATDFTATSGTLNIAAGATGGTISVPIIGDTANEADETFFVNLSSPQLSTISDGQAVGTIISDDVLTVTAIAPSSGPASGSSPVTVSGTSFEPGAAVRFGTTPAPSTTWQNGGQIAAVTPPLPAGTVHDVVVTNSNGLSATLARGFLADFLDVPQAHIFHGAVETIARRGITTGCGGGNYCVDAPVRRDQMAVFLLRAKYGAAYVPPPATGTVFADVQTTTQFAAWIERLYAEGITGGCSSPPLSYCPAASVTRAQMAIFILRTKHGGSYTPPPATGIFEDLELSNPVTPWAEQLFREGITTGCSSNPLRYCPNDPNTRGQMAVFISAAFP